MKLRKLRLLAFAVASGRSAMVFFIGNQLMEWRISDCASRSADRARAWVERQIEALRPDVIVTENPSLAQRKGETSRSVTEAVSGLAETRQLLNPRVRRHHQYANKYEEADAIAELYPELMPWRPRWRRFYENEPRNTILFEAMSYALSILREPPRKPDIATG